VKLQEKTPAEKANDYVKHLESHPLDTEAREQLAIIYLDHYGRLDLAADQLEQMIQQPHQPGRLVARWLNLLADLQLRGGSDYETIRQTLQRIVDLDPKLAAAETARHRIDRLKLELKAKETSQTVQLGTYEQNIGLKRGSPPHFPPS
jgi:tetratricopeptide (TPR) repeat protein